MLLATNFRFTYTHPFIVLETQQGCNNILHIGCFSLMSALGMCSPSPREKATLTTYNNCIVSNINSADCH
ncbi:hypothetical protein XELAEV_18029954mg [Xenopus laevis]|uniref:Uncharacterized protein n=1 Tax=Xenopus laevis TaxID=8355 RepID=A0A974CSG8_XENLA|nr:hypothetical protein XELAEV_18029954mg [Xenopus laevis]